MKKVPGVIDKFYAANPKAFKAVSRFQYPLLLILMAVMSALWILPPILFRDSDVFEHMENLLESRLFLVFYSISGMVENGVPAGDYDRYQSLLEHTMHTMTPVLYIQMAAYLLFPLLLAFLVIKEYSRLLDGRSKIYLFTRFAEEEYQILLKQLNRKILTDIIDASFYGYLHSDVYSAGDDKGMAGGTVNAGGGNDAAPAGRHPAGDGIGTRRDMDQDGEAECRNLIRKVSRYERKKNKGKFEKAFFLVTTMPEVKPKSPKQMFLYQYIFSELGKIVAYKGEARTTSHVFDSITIIFTVASVLTAFVEREWVIKLALPFIACLMILVWLVSRLLSRIAVWRTAKEETMADMYELLEDIVVFGTPVYDIDSVDEYWKALKYCRWMCIKASLLDKLRGRQD